jgi:threonine aldolase
MAEDWIDLRSDTVTRPDAEMRRAMAEAEVGDDVYGEDPTVAVLEEEAAAAVGQEAALFVPTGTMGNQIALHLHARPGCEVICDGAAHILHFEMGAMAALSGLLPKPLPSPDGLMDPAAVEAAIAPDISYKSRTGLIAVENTHNLAGGTVYDRPRLAALIEVARRHRLPIHLDGARIFNAAVDLGVPAAELGTGFDSVQFCLSKGLGAPVGSLICGSRPFVAEARRVRKMFGGGMRQVGVLAAAGLVALRKGPARLADDHANARLLAEALAELPGIELDPTRVRTNIVVFALTSGDAGGFLARLRDQGVLGVPVGPSTIRLVTHRDAPRERVEQAIERIREAVG